MSGYFEKQRPTAMPCRRPRLDDVILRSDATCDFFFACIG
jgi:hypothetical protein